MLVRVGFVLWLLVLPSNAIRGKPKVKLISEDTEKTTEMMTPSPPKVIPTTTPMTTTTVKITTTTEAESTTTEQPTTTEETTTQEMTTQIPTTTTTEMPTTTPLTTTERTTTTTLKTTTTTERTTTVATTTTSTTTTTTTTQPTTTTTRRTTTTTKATTTTKPTTTTSDPSDRRYGSTSDFHLSDLLSIGVPVYKDGPVSSSEDAPEGFGTSADFGENDEDPERSCLKVNDLTRSGASSEAHLKCWRNPINCKLGFSAAIWAEVVLNRRDADNKRYLFSTGGDEDGTPGVSIYYSGVYFVAIVSTGEKVWRTSAAGLRANDTWSSVAFAWAPREGLELYINGKLEASSTEARPIPPPPKPSQKPLQLTLGCRRIKKETYQGFVRGKLDEFVTWQYKIDPSNADFFLGGIDPNKLCKPEKHPMGCSSDMRTILQKIDETNMLDIDNAMTTIMHISDVATAKAQAQSTAESKSDVDKSSEDAADKQNDLKKERLDDLKTMIAIVKKLVNKTSSALSPAVNPDDLSVLYKMQDLVSIIMSDSNIDLWKQLKVEGEDATDFMKSVQDWSTTKLTESVNEEGQDVDVTLITESLASRSEKSKSKELVNKHQPYIYFPDYNKDPKWKQLKSTWGQPNDQLRVPTAIFDTIDEEISIHSVYHKNYHKIVGNQNSLTGFNTTGVLLDSRVITFEVKPFYDAKVLKAQPVIVFLEHYSEKTKKAEAESDQVKEEPKIDEWECVVWSDMLEFPGHISLGGWTTDHCIKVNSTTQYTTCSCDSLGTFALLGVLEKPKVYIEPEDETWVFALRGLGYSFSIIVLICYISAIAVRPSLHDQFHMIRLNLAIAAVGTTLSLFSVDFKRHDWEACRVLSGFIHYFYLVVGCWLSILTHAMFKAFIRGVVEGRICFYLLTGWGLPLVYVGVVVASSPNYGYDDRCMVGSTRSMRCSLACPLAAFGMGCLVWSTVICCNLSSPQIKRIEVVEELNASSKMLFCVSVCFFVIWMIGLVAMLELDAINARSWRKTYQIINAWMGCIIVLFLGLGSKHFRYAVFEKYAKFLNVLNYFSNNRVEPSRFEYTNGYRFDFKHYYLN